MTDIGKDDPYWGDEQKERDEQAAEARLAKLQGIPQKRYQDVAPKPWQGGLIHGPSGVGKTREAVARARSLPRVIFYEATEFIEDARLIELDRADELQQKRHDWASAKEYLVLDDLGARRPTAFAEDAILRLVNHRWKEGLETLVTSNLAPAQIAEIWGERIASRIFGFGSVLTMAGPDRRIEP